MSIAALNVDCEFFIAMSKFLERTGDDVVLSMFALRIRIQIKNSIILRSRFVIGHCTGL